MDCPTAMQIIARPKRARRRPARREGRIGAHHDIAEEVTRRIQQRRNPLERENVRRHYHGTLVLMRRRQEVKANIEIAYPGGHVDVKSVEINRIAPPCERATGCARRASGGNRQPGKFLDRSLRRMIAGQPRGVEQDEWAGANRDRLDDTKDTATDVAGIDRQRDGARISNVTGGGNRVGDRHGLRAAGSGRHRGHLSSECRGEQECGSSDHPDHRRFPYFSQRSNHAITRSSRSWICSGLRIRWPAPS